MIILWSARFPASTCLYYKGGKSIPTEKVDSFVKKVHYLLNVFLCCFYVCIGTGLWTDFRKGVHNYEKDFEM